MIGRATNETGRWKTQGRPHGVRGPGVWKTRGLKNTRSGERHGVLWKTRSLSKKQGGTIISPSYEFSSFKCEVKFSMKINSASRLGMEHVFDHKSKFENIS